MMKRVFPILALSMFSSSLGIGIVSPLLPLYAKDLGASGIWLGLIFAAYSTSGGIVAPFVGRLSDRKGRKLFLCVGLLTYAIVSSGLIWTNNITQLIAIRLLQGLAGAATSPIASAYIGDLSPKGEEGKWMSYANTAFWSGFGFGPFIGGALSDRFGVTVTFVGLVGLNLLAALIAFFFLPEVAQRQTGRNLPRLSFREIKASGMMKGLFCFRLTEAFGRGGVMTFLPIVATTMGLSRTLVGVLLSVSIMLVFLMAPLGGWMADKFNRKILIVSGKIIFIISMVLLPMSNNFGQLLVVMLIGQGISASISMTAASALVVEEGRKYGMGSTMGIFMMAMSIGNAVGPIASGGIAELGNIDYVFYFAAVLGIIGVGLFAWFTKLYRR